MSGQGQLFLVCSVKKLVVNIMMHSLQWMWFHMVEAHHHQEVRIENFLLQYRKKLD